MAVFCFTDIEGSTRKWEEHRDVMGKIIARHNAILQEKVAQHGGTIIKFTGDGMFAVFHDMTTSSALDCAIAIQKAVQAEVWPEIGELRIRMALHAGEAEQIEGDYFGPVANRTARLMALGWGGQILISEALKKTIPLPAASSLEDLGVHQVKDLPEPQQVYGLVHPELLLHEFPAPKSLSARPHNLPLQASPFVGRKDELAALGELLSQSEYRLFCLLGPGGIGKTRLAIESALENLPRFRHGAFFVDLTPLADPGQLAHQIGDAIKLRFYEREDPHAQLINFLRERQLLLVLDNFEHVVQGAAFVAELLDAAPKIRILVTSRERLNLSAERVVSVEGLTYPDSPQGMTGSQSYSAIDLFLLHARRVRPDFELRAEDHEWLVKLCRLVVGMPLGLALAAAWTRAISVKAIAQRVETDIAFLSGSQRDVPERHRSIKAVFEYSWSLLRDEEKSVLARLSVFQGSFDLEAAEQVAGASLDSMSALVDKSLLSTAPGVRYVLHPAVRQLAGQKLKEIPGEERATLDRHCDYYCDFMSAKEKNVRGEQLVSGLSQIRTELENVRSAFRYAVATRRIRAIAQSADCLGIYLVTQGLGRQQADTIDLALELWDPKNDEPFDDSNDDALKAHASLLLRRAFFYHSSGRPEAIGPAEQALAMFRQLGDKQALGDCLVLLSVFVGHQNPAARGALCREGLALFEEIGDRNGAAWARANLAATLHTEGKDEEALPAFQESLAVFREVGNPKEEAWTLVGISIVDHDAGRHQEAMRSVEQAVHIFRQLGDMNAAAICLGIITEQTLSRKDWPAARAAARQALALYRDLGYEQGIADAVRTMREIEASAAKP